MSYENPSAAPRPRSPRAPEPVGPPPAATRRAGARRGDSRGRLRAVLDAAAARVLGSAPPGTYFSYPGDALYSWPVHYLALALAMVVLYSVGRVGGLVGLHEWVRLIVGGALAVPLLYRGIWQAVPTPDPNAHAPVWRLLAPVAGRRNIVLECEIGALLGAVLAALWR
jgi:hypothetical protein